MATVKIDLSKIAPEISKSLDEIRKKADELERLARDLYMKLGYDVTVECENSEEK